MDLAGPAWSAKGGAQVTRILTRKAAAIAHTEPLTSLARPAMGLIAAKAMKPRPMPWAMEKVSGMVRAVTTAGTYSVASSQRTSASARAIRQATKNSAGAVA